MIDSSLCGLAWAPVILLLTFVILRSPVIAARTGFPPDQFPVKAATIVEKLPESVRLLAPDKFGGYLIYRFSGRRKVFMDGRSDFYGLDFMKRYIELVEVAAGLAQHRGAVRLHARIVAAKVFVNFRAGARRLAAIVRGRNSRSAGEERGLENSGKFPVSSNLLL